ncbi:MAG: TRAP transporter small permease [Lachnospiraceae bacterium]|nr:TRAP transporter small permease [Lachnospiraceae bacterium]
MDKLKKAILNLDLIIAGLTTVIIVIITLAGVFMRKVVGQPFPWIEEVQLLLFIWAIFFGASVAFRTGSHVGIDIIAERLPAKARKILDLFIFIVSTIILVYFLWASYGLSINAGAKLTPYLRLPYWVIDSSAVIGSAVMIIQNTHYTYLKITGKLPKEGEE